jgi:hypothetical protein
MLRFIKLLILIPLTIALILLGIANRHLTTLHLDPWPIGNEGTAITLPLFVLVFGVFAVGVIYGWLASWFAQSGHRKAERAYRHERDALAQECAKLKAERTPALPG